MTTIDEQLERLTTLTRDIAAIPGQIATLKANEKRMNAEHAKVRAALREQLGSALSLRQPRPKVSAARASQPGGGGAAADAAKERAR